MPRIRKIEIQNFRGHQELCWLPSVEINCLIGPGDSSKSSIRDAIDYCVGARRNIQFSEPGCEPKNRPTSAQHVL